MGRCEKHKELLCAWESLLQGLGVEISWSVEVDTLYGAQHLSMDLSKKEEVPIPERLTSRENQVFQWMLQGKSSREIALILGVSCRTVEKHIQNIYHKSGAHGRDDFFGISHPQNSDEE